MAKIANTQRKVLAERGTLMLEKMIVVSNGIKDGQEYSILRAVREGISKKGTPYAMIDNESFQKENSIIPLGTFVNYERKRVDDSWGDSSAGNGKATKA